MKEGTVKFFNEAKGFGFINDSASGKDVFVHSSGLTTRIKENDKVSYRLEETSKGLNAVDVKMFDN